MKKTSKFLSTILALVMAFALAVPAFAEEAKSLTLEEVDFSVAPIGVATLKGEIEGMGRLNYENVYVFDQDVVATLKDGLGFTEWGWSDVIHQSGAGDDAEYPWENFQMTADHSGITWFGRGASMVCRMVTKAYLDELTAAGFTVVLTPLGQSTTANKPAPGVSVPLNDGTGEFLYTVKSGDSLSRIAAYYYGDMNVYKLIYERNKDTLPNANTIYAGKTIILPSYAAVSAFKAGQATAPTAPAEAEKPAGPEQPAAAKPAPGVSVPLNDGSGEFLYTIKSGDSLSRIAAYYYGDANVYKLIYERNKDTLKNANTIYAGQTIILPSYSAVNAFKATAK